MPLATFCHFIGLGTCIILGVAQCGHTITVRYAVKVAAKGFSCRHVHISRLLEITLYCVLSEYEIN